MINWDLEAVSIIENEVSLKQLKHIMNAMDSIKLSNKACVLVRDITRVECTWLKRDFKINEVVYLYEGHTYNCISRNGKAYTEIEDTKPFVELPNDATRLLE